MDRQMKPQNPFLIVGYYSPEYFCNRNSETETIINALRNDRSLTLIAPRRMGKTGLIKNVFYKLYSNKEQVETFYMDIYSTQNLHDFTQTFASTILGQLDSTTHKTLAEVGKLFKNLRPIFSFDEVTGNPTVTIDIASNREEATLKEIFDYLKQSDKHCLIAIDEFQQIAEYPEKGVEALLRSYIQFIPNVHFIFAGSKQHIMQEMFLSAKRPFYQSTQTISIDVIKPEDYYQFAARFFNEQGYELHKDVFDKIYNEFNGHTWYVQSVLNRLYSYRQNTDAKLADNAINEIVAEGEYPYQNLLSAYSPGAVRLLRAIAKEGIVAEINSGDFIAKYTLKGASSVNSALKKLIDKELIYKTPHGYIVYDRFMAIWLCRLP